MLKYGVEISNLAKQLENIQHHMFGTLIAIHQYDADLADEQFAMVQILSKQYQQQLEYCVRIYKESLAKDQSDPPTEKS